MTTRTLPVHYTDLMGPDALVAELRHIAAASGGAATLEIVGTSRSGRPIQMLSIGDGPRSALMTAGAHANEPSGPVAVCAFAARLVDDPALLMELGHRWHFVACVDPDGLAMNEGWLAERTPQAYFEHFFRPAIPRQGEFSFPLTTGNYHFDRQTAENRAWCEAFERTRPSLYIDTHNSDMAGVFYVGSRTWGELAETLAAQPDALGLLLNPVGEPFGSFSGMPEFGTGFFAVPDMPAAARAGKWHAGNCSWLYAAENYGAYSFVAEAPLWDDPRMRDTRLSHHTLGDAITRQIARLELLSDTLPKALRELPVIEEGDMGELHAALVEAAEATSGAIAEMKAIGAARDWSEPVSISEFTFYDGFLSFIYARTPAMLARYARAIADSNSQFAAIADAAEQQRDAAVAAALEGTTLKSLPIETVIKVHIDSAIAVARALTF